MKPVKSNPGLLFTLLSLILPIRAVATPALETLELAYADRMLPIYEIQHVFSRKLAGCSDSQSSADATSEWSEQQRIKGILFHWKVRKIDEDKLCVVLIEPEQRGLSIQEAQLFLSAWKAAFDEFDSSSSDNPYSAKYAHRHSFGAPDSYDAGTINGHPYVLHYKGMGASMTTLGNTQFEFAENQKKRLKMLSPRARGEPDPILPKLRVTCTGDKTFELASLFCQSWFRDAERSGERQSWLFHIPTNRFVTFDDFFSNPRAARKRVSRLVSRHSPPLQGFFFELADPEEARMRSDAAQLHYQTEYAKAWKLATTPRRAHFRNVLIDADLGFGDAVLHIYFRRGETIPGSGDVVVGDIPIDKLRDLLKPEFRRAFDAPPPIR